MATLQKSKDIFDSVFAVIRSRKGRDPKSSYVASLLQKGTEKINAKIFEEAVEVCEAGLAHDKKHLTHEAADLVFHLFVLLSHQNISLKDLRAELKRRFGVSGHVEKASRTKALPKKSAALKPKRKSPSRK